MRLHKQADNEGERHRHGEGEEGGEKRQEHMKDE